VARLDYKPGFDKRLREAQGPRLLEAFSKDSRVSASQLSRYGDPDGPRPRRGVLARIANAAYGGPINPLWLATGDGPMRGVRIPISTGRGTGGWPLAPEDTPSTEGRVSVVVAGLLVTIIVQPSSQDVPKG
jgi:hypothetical protein